MKTVKLLQRKEYVLASKYYRGTETDLKWNGLPVPAFQRPVAVQIITDINKNPDCYPMDFDEDTELILADHVSSGNMFIIPGLTFEEV